MKLMNKIDKFIPRQAIEVIDKIQSKGYSAYLVGGFVRDIVLDRIQCYKPDLFDIDIATSALPEEIIPLFNKVIPTGLKHGTVTTIYDGVTCEITTFRVDKGYSNKRHPDNVEFVTDIKDDLSRRDLTINAMAYDPIERKFQDPFGGLKDCNRRIVRTVGVADKRFTEDGLRIMRAIRFATTIAFEIEDKTFRAIKKNVNNLDDISRERIRDEFNKIIMSDRPSHGIELLRKTGILKKVLPELEAGFGVEQNEYHIHDIYHHNLYSCDFAQKDLIIRLAALLHDIGKVDSMKEYNEGSGKDYNVFYNHEHYSEQIANNFMRSFKYSKKEIDLVRRLIRFHMFHYTDEWTDGAVRRFVKKVGEDLIPKLFSLRIADRIGNGKNYGYPEILIRFYEKIEQIIKDEHAIKVTDLSINGNDLIKNFNLHPSKIIGKTLNYLLELVIDEPELNNKTDLLHLASQYIESKGKI